MAVALDRVPVDAPAFRDAMALLAAAVNVVTTDGPAGRHGFTASAVTSVTDSPATLLVCARRDGSATPAIRANGVVCVNTLAAGQQEIGGRFGGRLAAEDRFAGAAWSRLVTGAPALDGALVACDCRIASVVEVGTHSVLFCEVLAVATRPGAEALLWFRRGYRTL